MSQRKVTKILLDANVLYPAPIRDLLLNIACQGYCYPKWSGDIHREWSTNLLKNRQDIKPRQLERTILLMNEVFPDANVRGLIPSSRNQKRAWSYEYIVIMFCYYNEVTYRKAKDGKKRLEDGI